MTVPESFEDLAASRREWIETVLRPWCRQAGLKQLQKLAMEWQDFAGRADPDATLWTWAWERFPDIVHENLPGVNETHEVTVTLEDGTAVTGFPDGRRSRQGYLVLTGRHADYGPYPIDQIVAVRRQTSD